MSRNLTFYAGKVVWLMASGLFVAVMLKATGS